MRTGKRRALIAALAAMLAIGLGTWRFVRSAAPDARSGASADDVATSARAGEAATARDAADARTADSRQADPDTSDARADAGFRDASSTGPDDAASRTTLGSSDPPGGPHAIYILADAPGEGSLSTRVRGMDVGAPRDLVLWRVRDGRRTRLAEGFSTPDGALHFPDVLVPDELELVVTAAEEGAEGTDESDPAHVHAGGLRPPQLHLRRSADGSLAIRVSASRALGSVVLAGPGGAELARMPVPPTPSPTRRVMDVSLPAAQVGDAILVAHELPDGARSEWRPYLVPPRPATGQLEPHAVDSPDAGVF